MPPRAAALALEAPKLGFLITRPEGVVALGVLEPALKANGLDASWPPAIGAGEGAALLLFSPKVKLLLAGSGAAAPAPKENPDVDDGPPKLAEKSGADPDWPLVKLKFIPPADGVFPPNMVGADVLGVLCVLPKLKAGALFALGVEEV